MASKIVTSNVREWGRTVHANSVASLNRKYKVTYDKWVAKRLIKVKKWLKIFFKLNFKVHMFVKQTDINF